MADIGIAEPTDGSNKIAPMGDKKSDPLRPPHKKEKPSKKDDAKLMERARKRFDRCVTYEGQNRKHGVLCLRMINNDQWDSNDLKNRQNRPSVTVNKMKSFVNQVANGQRENRPAINISPEGDRGDREVARMLKGVVRKIERDSAADIAYDTAFWNACANGIGWWRITTDWEGPNTFDQNIEIKRVRNPFSVYDDPDSQEPDGADAKFRFVTEMMQRDDFKEQFPKADPIDFSGINATDTFKNWINEKEVRIAEYFEITYDKTTLYALSNGWIGTEEELADDVRAKIDSGELEIENEREVEVPTVMWYKITAKEILSREKWAGKFIPLVKVVGNEIDIEGKVHLSGVISDALDSQRMYNFWASLQTEVLALSPKAPWLIAEGQIEDYEDKWDQANTQSLPYLVYKPVTLDGQAVPPPQRTAFAGSPAGFSEARQQASQDMQATTGIRFDATMHERTNDESGRALHEIRRATDIGTFHFGDNFARSLRHCGVILIDLIPRIIDTKRIKTIIRDNDKEETIAIDPSQSEAVRKVNHPQKPGQKIKSINPSFGRYGVTVTTGPSYATKRIEASQSMTDFIRAVPQAAPAIMDLIAKNQDWPDAEVFAARLGKMVPAHLHENPNLDGLPPEIQGMIGSQQQEIMQMRQQLMQALKKLTERQTEFALTADKQDKDFEAKLLAIIQKADAAQAKQVGDKVDALGQQVTGLMDVFTQHGEALKAMAMAQQQQTQPGQPAQGEGQPPAQPGMTGQPAQ